MSESDMSTVQNLNLSELQIVPECGQQSIRHWLDPSLRLGCPGHLKILQSRHVPTGHYNPASEANGRMLERPLDRESPCSHATSKLEVQAPIQSLDIHHKLNTLGWVRVWCRE